MLVLTRKPGEKVVVDGDISITVITARDGRVRLAIDAPKHVSVLRGELAGWLDDGTAGLAAKNRPTPSLPTAPVISASLLSAFSEAPAGGRRLRMQETFC